MASTITVDKIKGGTSGVALTLPTTDGLAGQLLKTNGSEVLGWATTNLAADTTPQLGGFLDANGNYMQTEKGADIVSASPLVITTVGDYFDVTGAVSFAVMTVAADRQFTLQFDGILTMTHHATNLDLPGEANITTAVGDVATFQSTGANTVQCINYTKADGTSIAIASTVVLKTSDTGSAILPSGTTAQQDGSPSAGYIRWNTTDTSAEVYDGSDWAGVGGAAGMDDVSGVARATSGLLFNSDTAAANTLDDYEEGTWTPTVITGSGVSMGTIHDNRYTKTGRVVTLSVSFNLLCSSSPGTGDVRLGGFPFTITGSEVSFPINVRYNYKPTPSVFCNSGGYIYYQNTNVGGNNQEPFGTALDGSQPVSMAFSYITT